MTETLISLLSIAFGIIGANVIGFMLTKYSFGIVGNTMAGVFGSIFLIKTVGRLGLDPTSIMMAGSVNWTLFILNVILSFSGGALAIVLIHKLKASMNKIQESNNNIE